MQLGKQKSQDVFFRNHQLGDACTNHNKKERANQTSLQKKDTKLYVLRTVKPKNMDLVGRLQPTLNHTCKVKPDEDTCLKKICGPTKTGLVVDPGSQVSRKLRTTKVKWNQLYSDYSIEGKIVLIVFHALKSRHPGSVLNMTRKQQWPSCGVFIIWRLWGHLQNRNWWACVKVAGIRDRLTITLHDEFEVFMGRFKVSSFSSRPSNL